MKNNLKTALLLLFYILIISTLLFAQYYFQFRFSSTFFFVILFFTIFLLMMYFYKKISKKLLQLLVISSVLILLIIPLRLLVMNLFDLYLFTNEEFRTEYVKQAATKFINAIENANEDALNELSPDSSDYCNGEAQRMASSTYSDYYGKDIEITNIEIYHSNHEDADSFHIDIRYRNGEDITEDSIYGVTILMDGKLYICGETY